MFFFVNLSSQDIVGDMSGTKESSEAENLFWSKLEKLQEKNWKLKIISS